MAQLYFRYSTMNAGKSIEIIKIAHNYEEQNKSVILFAPKLDTRYGMGKISSRVGFQRDAICVDDTTDIIGIIKEKHPFCVLVDEGQFLTRQQVVDLTYVVDNFNIPVIVYGLKNDFSNRLFEGSEALLVYADKIEEVKTVCWFCNKKATMNLRFSDGKPIYEGEQIQIGGNESYLPVCRRCYNNASEKLKTYNSGN